MEVSIVKQPSERRDLFVVPVAEGAETAGPVRELSGQVREMIAARVERTSYRAKPGKTLLVQTPAGDVLLSGLGGGREAENYRRAVAASRQAAESVRARTVEVVLAGAAASRYAEAALEGFVLANYRFSKYRSGDEDEWPGPEELTVVAPPLAGRKGRAVVERVQRVRDAVFLARDLVNETSSVKTPTFLAKTAKALAREHGLRCEVWQGERLKKEAMNGILAVSAGSREPGALVQLHYVPKRRPKAKVAVVGKGITFDSGGLSLKPAKSMEWMKQDMSGAAAVLGIMKGVAQLGLPVEVRGYLAAAENMPGGGAQKPGDVIRFRNGKTAEVLNTDAEGRLVLADALCLAAEEKPDCIVDLATLTGACMVALGVRVAGVLGNDQGLVNALIRHGRETGETLWQLPLVEDYTEDIRSKVADIKNVGDGWGGTITAALFLRNFVGDVRWAHLDIAGPAFAEKPMPLVTHGGTGFGVRLVLSYLSSL
ncbi:MAG: leucyl aminopeptidase [Candidatus Dadabacteria bacterium]|nr:MAG: leucyl aminopeptidase [Candidatus Dadabacteria bacterium]